MSRNTIVNGSLMLTAGVPEARSTNFVGSMEQWNSLTHQERVQYETADISNDYVYVIYEYNCPAGATDNGGMTYTQVKVYNVDLVLRDNGFNAPTASAVNYVFNSWNTQPDGTGVTYAAGATYSINAPVTLYAIWEEEPIVGYILSWASPLAYTVQGKYDYLGDGNYVSGTSYQDKQGWKRIKYTNINGAIAYANPFESGSIEILPNSSVELQMIAGIIDVPSVVYWNGENEQTAISCELITNSYVPESSGILTLSNKIYVNVHITDVGDNVIWDVYFTAT